MQREIALGHLLGKRGVHEPLNRRHAAIAGRELQDAAAVLLELCPDLPVRVDIGAAEPVDRLLRVAHDEELARDGPRRSAGARARIVGREKQQDLGLNRVGVLELVNEDPFELRLQVPPDALVGSDQVACPREEIDEVERTGGRLEGLVPRGCPGKLALQAGREVRVGVTPELLEIGTERVPRGQDVGPRDVLPEHVAAALSRPRKAAVADEIDEP